MNNENIQSNRERGPQPERSAKKAQQIKADVQTQERDKDATSILSLTATRSRHMRNRRQTEDM